MVSRSLRALTRVLIKAQVVFGLVLIAVPRPGAGQARRPLVGVVTDRVTSAPLAGVYVVLEERGIEQVVAAALTDESGRFVFPARVGGTYRLSAERVGLGTESTDWFVFADDGVAQRIAMVERAVELEGLSVRGQVRTCQLERDEALIVQRWWDEVRKALQVTAFGEASALAGLRFQRFERAWSSNLRALRHERQLPPDSVSTRPFLSQSPEALSERGFVQGREGERLFLAPDAAVLFSQAFLDDHCLRIAEAEDEVAEGGARRPGDLYLAVEPIRDDPPDIRGVVTIDTLTGELRTFDFLYVNLPPDIPRTRAGGHLTFSYLPSGAWIVSDWWVRVPQVEYRWGEGDRRGAVPLVRGYVDQGGRALDAEGRPMESEPGVGRTTVHGMAWDSLSGRPMVGAQVTVVGSRLSARTGADGRFTLAGVPAGRRSMTIHHPNLNRLGLPSPVFALDLTAGKDSVLLATPGFTSTARLMCPDAHEPIATVLTGEVLASGSSNGAPSAEIRARWVDATGTMRSGGRTGADGTYVLCGLPAAVPVSFAVRMDSAMWKEAGIATLAEHAIAALDLRPGADALATLRGTVRAAEGGDPLPGAEVQVLSVTGDTVASGRADTSGVFQATVAPGVGYRAVATAPGYLREASALFTVDGTKSIDIGFELIEDAVAGVAMKIEGLRVEVAARRSVAARRLLRQYGQSESSMGRRWIGVATLDSIPSTGEADPGVAIARQGIPGVWVDQAAKRGRNAYLCVQQTPRRCSLIILNGVKVDLGTALLIDFRELEGIAVLRPEDATTFFGTEGGGGAVVLWMRGSGG